MEKIWLKNYPQGVPHEIALNEYNSIMDVFDESVRKFRQKVAFTNMGQEITFADLDRKVGDFASFLQNELNLKKGDRIAIQMPNLLQFPVCLFGALRAGLIVVNTNPLYTAREMKHQFNDSGAKALVILANFAHLYEKIQKEVPVESVVVTEIGDLLSFPKSLIVNSAVKYLKKMVPNYNLPQAYSFSQAMKIGAQMPYQEVNCSLEDIAFLQYTGGTTGVAKGAMLSHRNICANMNQISAWMKPLLKEGEETVITALPMYHIFSLTLNCMAFMKYGARNVLITNPRDIPGFIKELQKEKWTALSGVNTLFNALLNHPEFEKLDFSAVKLSVAGGMALQQAVAARWKKVTKTPVVEGYGLTETSPVASCNPVDGTDRTGSIGIPLPSTEMKIIDEEGQELGIGETGEICIKGPQVMQGYWQRPEETQKVMLGEWFKSGDMATVDSDGFFKIVDRKKDMILVSGFNVYPNEIEEVASAHPGVLEVAAVGVPDEKSGEIVRLYVVRKDPQLSEEELIRHCKAELTSYKVPKSVVFKEELPKTNVGKILRRELREEAP